MSKKHPIVAVTGASGAGTTVVEKAFREIFHRQGIKAAFVHGDAFQKYNYEDMCRHMAQAEANGHPVSCYGPDLNDFARLETLFREYSATGTGTCRQYVTADNAAAFQLPVGSFSSWQPLPSDTDLLFYEGLHGGVVAQTWTRRKVTDESILRGEYDRRRVRVNKGVNAAQYVDLLIAVAPAINLEWIQKIHNDHRCRRQPHDVVVNTIMERLRDYIHFIVPQFSISDIIFQRMPVVDTSDPFVARDVPTESESVIVVSFREPKKYNFPYFLKRINGSYMTRPATMLIPGGEMRHALDVICAPMIEACCGK
ncbi:MAG: phosphoribulokinase [Pseudomonadota bacterium]|nr:phosphoribulokinase [Pseudomonadota bacterium]